VPAGATPTETARPTPADALELGRAMFLRHERVDLRRIAQELGVGRTTIYRWVGDREQLLGEIMGELNERAWQASRSESGGEGLPGLRDTVDRFAALTTGFGPAVHFARTETAMAIRVLMNPEGRVRRDMVERIAEELAAHADPDAYAPETADVLVELSIALVWTPIAIGREPDLDRLRRLLNALVPPARQAA
jgi:AcrR family transcriptional regulator